MTQFEFLRGYAEQVPTWLDNFTSRSEFERSDFFASRTVIYPGSGIDGQPVKLFGSTHSTHCFIYADYGWKKSELETALQSPTNKFKGYHTFVRIQLSEHDLSPGGWRSHIMHGYEPPHGAPHINTSPFGFLEILERDDNLDDEHGPSRLAIIFLGADGIATYDALYCQHNGTSSPFAIILQDHGFGGNYDRYGANGLLENIALGQNAMPKFMLLANNTDTWTGYERIQNVEGYAGGMHGHIRYLHRHRV